MAGPPAKNRAPALSDPERIHENTVTVRLARNYFWKAVEAATPEVLEDLARILPDFKQFHNSFFPYTVGPPDYRKHIKPASRISIWADRWGLDPAWCSEDALTILEAWRNDQGTLDNILAGVFLSTKLADAARLFVFVDASWDPSIERWGVARKRIEGDFRRELTRYQQRVEAIVQGWPKIRFDKKTLDHFEWLARYQFRNEEFSAIANDLQKDQEPLTAKGKRRFKGDEPRRAIEQGVRRSADLIGLPLRPGLGPGRPPGP